MKINWDSKVREAYTRLKSYVYYDNFNLVLRAKLSEYEASDDFHKKLKRLAKILKAYSADSKKIPSELKTHLENISFISLPKSVEPGESISFKNIGILTNVDDGEKNITVRKSNFLIDADIEIHLIATLWVQEEGVLLSKKMDKDSYGYHLLVNNDKNQLLSKRLTFTPYFEKYQAWRDKGLEIAKKVINDGNDVTLLSLDIKSFFPSAKIDFDKLKEDISKLGGKILFTELLQKISISYNAKLESRKLNNLQLPIGIISSGVIANWYLTPIDKKLKDSLAPSYYGRYVDDLFIVLSNVKPPDPEYIPGWDQALIKYKQKFGKSEDSESAQKVKEIIYKKLLIDSLFPGKNGVLQATSYNPNKIKFLKPYSNLEIQTEKVRIFYFSPEWPLALLNKFAKTLKENSSAFWFLPEEEDLRDTFEEKAFDLHYEDSFNKFRSVVDVKSSKYGASVFLAKRIKLRSLADDSDDEATVQEIKRFFKGPNLIELFGLWEKVFTYFVVSDDFEGFEMFYDRCLKVIELLQYNPIVLILNKKNSKAKQLNVLKKTLKRHLKSSASIALALNPTIINSKKKKTFGDIKIIIEHIIPSIRKSALYRHHYLQYTFLSITEYGQNQKSNLLIREPVFNEIKLNQLIIPYDKGAKKTYWLIPRLVFVQEICLLSFYRTLLGQKKRDPAKPYFSMEDDEDYSLKEILSLTKRINQKSFNFKEVIDANPKLGKHFEKRNNAEQNIIFIEKVLIESKPKNKKSQSLRIGLANIKIYADDIEESISNKSIASKKKRKKILHILNEAEKLKSDVLLLPENSIPLQWLHQLTDESRRKKRALIFGLEHFNFESFCFNIGVTVLPFEWQGVKDALIIPRIKNHYSHSESCKIKSYGLKIPKQIPALYHLFKWNGCYFTLYNCFELADIVHRSLFRSRIDVLFAIEYNKDVNYFSNVVESFSRDIHCYVVQSNSREFGDTRIVQPTESVRMNPARIKGGENDVVLLGILDILELRKFQEKRFACDNKDKTFKLVPPDFDHDLIKRRLRDND